MTNGKQEEAACEQGEQTKEKCLSVCLCVCEWLRVSVGNSRIFRGLLRKAAKKRCQVGGLCLVGLVRGERAFSYVLEQITGLFLCKCQVWGKRVFFVCPTICDFVCFALVRLSAGEMQLTVKFADCTVIMGKYLKWHAIEIVYAFCAIFDKSRRAKLSQGNRLLVRVFAKQSATYAQAVALAERWVACLQLGCVYLL